MRKEKWTAREAAEMKASDERDKLDEQDGVHYFMSRPTCVKGWQETEEQAWASKTDYNPPRPFASVRSGGLSTSAGDPRG